MGDVMPAKSTRLTITMDCWDKYKDARTLFFESLKRNWGDLEYPLVIACNKPLEKESLPGKVIVCGDDSTDSLRQLQAVRDASSEYVLLVVEDGLITETIRNNRIEEILDFMDSHSIDFCKMVNAPNKRGRRIHGYPHLKYIRKRQAYGINYLCGIYRKTYILSLLESGCKDSWEIEKMLLSNAAHAGKGYYNDKVIATDNPLHIRFCIEQGKWSHWAMKYIHSNGYVVESDRGVWSWQHDLLSSIKHFMSTIIPTHSREKLKRVFSRLGIKFVTNQ